MDPKVNGPKKALYVFLAMLLGILLFVTIQRSLSLIAILLLNLDYAKYSLGTNPTQIHAANLASFILAVFFGGWYGTWLGLHWYGIVYDKNTGGLWHGLVGNFFHDHEPLTTTKTKASQSGPKMEMPIAKSPVDSIGAGDTWEFDQLLPRKRTVKPTTRSSSKIEEKEEIVVKSVKPAAKKRTPAKPRASKPKIAPIEAV